MNILIIGYIVTILGTIPAANQIRHSWRLSSVAGISGATTWAWVWSWTVWVVYGFSIGNGPVMLHNFVGLVPAVVLLYTYVKLTKIHKRLPYFVAAAYLAVGATMLADPEAGVWLLIILDTIFYAPSVVAVFRNKEPRGVSLASSITLAALTGSWLTYLVLAGIGVAGIGVAVGFISHCTIAYKVHAWRGRRTHPTGMIHEKSDQRTDDEGMRRGDLHSAAEHRQPALI